VNNVLLEAITMKSVFLFMLCAFLSLCQSNPVLVPERTPCPSLPPFEYGEATLVSDNGWDEVCRVAFTCNPGYMLNGVENLYCFYGEWVGEMPVCRETSTCVQIESPMNGYVEYVGPIPAGHLHSILEVKCVDGYVVDGDSVVLCKEDGQWSTEIPQCIPHSCSQNNITADSPSASTDSQSGSTDNIKTTPPTETPTYPYRYELSSILPGKTWDSARSYCQSKGGDLPFHGFENMQYREKVLCEDLNYCDDFPGENRGHIVWLGLKKTDGTTDQWEYSDGTPATAQDIHWMDLSYASTVGGDCGYLVVGHEFSHHLEAFSQSCDSTGYFICEFAI